MDAGTAEIRTHRVMFHWILGPLLALWLPIQWNFFAIAVTGAAIASSVGSKLVDGSQWEALQWAMAAIAAVVFASVGAVREWQRQQAEMDRAIAASIVLPAPQAQALSGVIGELWENVRATSGVEFGPTPAIICQPHFQMLAHAYDDGARQMVEVSAGLAARILQRDELALWIVRHEMAHLIFKDLPSIHRQAIVVAAVRMSLQATAALCAVGLGASLLYVDAIQFPLEVTLANVLAVQAALLLTATIVMVPLFLGRFTVRRYAGFIVALIETRADASAGLWGPGLVAFSQAMQADPALRPSTWRDFGLAYLSPTISHLPALHRADLLRHPSRLAAPKLGYFIVAIAVVWLMGFHQGTIGWDFALLCLVIALVQALSVYMLMAARGQAPLPWLRACGIAVTLLIVQALPLVSIEGWAYLAESLTAALVTPGGFGVADESYLGDVSSTFSEFSRHAAEALDGYGCVLAAMSSSVLLWLLSRRRREWTRPTGQVVIATAAFLSSLLVSNHFFSDTLSVWLRLVRFHLASDVGADDGASLLRQDIVNALYAFSDALKDVGPATHWSWGLLILPSLIGCAGALFLRREGGATRRRDPL